MQAAAAYSFCRASARYTISFYIRVEPHNQPSPLVPMRRIGLLLALSLWALPAFAQMEKPTVELTAHRGESYDAPENTMAALRLAWERNVPSVELDVHLTKDGRLILSHDANTKRTTGVDKLVKESTLEELQALDAGSWKGQRWAGERMPTLEEALTEVPAGTRVFIEVKVGPEAIPALVKAVRESGKAAEQLVVISFNIDTIAESKRQLPELKAYYLSSFKKDEATGAWTPTIDELIQRAKGAGADGLDLSYNGPIDAEAARRIKAAGLELYVWTVDDPEIARRMVAAGVDGITTNRADWLRAELAKH